LIRIAEEQGPKQNEYLKAKKTLTKMASYCNRSITYTKSNISAKVTINKSNNMLIRFNTHSVLTPKISWALYNV